MNTQKNRSDKDSSIKNDTTAKQDVVSKETTPDVTGKKNPTHLPDESADNKKESSDKSRPDRKPTAGNTSKR